MTPVAPPSIGLSTCFTSCRSSSRSRRSLAEGQKRYDPGAAEEQMPVDGDRPTPRQLRVLGRGRRPCVTNITYRVPTPELTSGDLFDVP